MVGPNPSVPSCLSQPTLWNKRDLAGQHFLIDTGATALVYPSSWMMATKLACLPWLTGLAQKMFAVNGTEVKLLVKVTKMLRFASWYHWHKFLLANIDCPLLGWDFLCACLRVPSMHRVTLVQHATQAALLAL